jgi:hypothetical protein
MSTFVDEELEKVKLVDTHGNAPYGSTEVGKHVDGDDDDTDEDEDLDETDCSELTGMQSFHLGKACKMLSHSNVWTSTRFTESFAEYGDEYEKVPSLLQENFMLLMDPNLDSRENGRLYYAESSIYKLNTDPHYALTVNCDIYQRILQEINDAQSIPCGLYFCCHGGDGAHTGVSHDDYVDIRVAYILASSMFLIMVVLAVYDDGA